MPDLTPWESDDNPLVFLTDETYEDYEPSPEAYFMVNGEPLTEELAEELADEAERGYDVSHLVKPRRRR